MERTEEDKLVQAPLRITLGGVVHEVKPLVIRDSRAWRRKLSAMLGQLPQYAAVTTDAPDDFKAALNAMLVSMPDQVVDLVFDYARDLNRQELEAVATDAEVAVAFEQIVEVAFPLARSVAGAMTKLSR